MFTRWPNVCRGAGGVFGTRLERIARMHPVLWVYDVSATAPRTPVTVTRTLAFIKVASQRQNQT